MRTFGNLRLQVLIASVSAALLAFLSLGVSAGEPVRATGTIEPEQIVDVGAQVTGMITSLGADPSSPGKIDYGSRVEAGTVLARIDDALYRVRVEIAQAAVARAEAELKDAKAKTSAGIPGTPLVPALEATLAKCRAELKLAETNLDYTIIKSPIKGVVIDRRVNVGQIVGPTPGPGSSLFLIASDLRKLQVWASVNEKDVRRIKVGTPVTFTVDAFPKLVFQGKVKQTRLNAQMTQNVVTYTVVVTTDNSDGKLLPYLTANVEFPTDP